METINLKQYYPFCTGDTFLEVSDEIVEAVLLQKGAEAAREGKMYRCKAFYTFDCDEGIENAELLPVYAGDESERYSCKILLMSILQNLNRSSGIFFRKLFYTFRKGTGIAYGCALLNTRGESDSICSPFD